MCTLRRASSRATAAGTFGLSGAAYYLLGVNPARDPWLVAYTMAAALVGLAIIGGMITVYLSRSMENPRLCNIVQWTMQALGVLLLASATADYMHLRANLALVVVMVTSKVVAPWLPKSTRAQSVASR
jgi:hypothetical protein